MAEALQDTILKYRLLPRCDKALAKGRSGMLAVTIRQDLCGHRDDRPELSAKPVEALRSQCL